MTAHVEAGGEPVRPPPGRSRLSPFDRMLDAAGRALATVAGAPVPLRPMPRPVSPSASGLSGSIDPGAASADSRSPGANPESAGDRLDPTAARVSAGLMRVNHVGEVCAQALYEGQAATARDDRLREFFLRAAAEETDHLAWTHQRLGELGARPSLLNPLWYAGSFALGALAGRLGDRVSLGFTVETERQVEEHLAGHLDRLPPDDRRSRAIVDVMRTDEAGHARAARQLGAVSLPAPVRWAMRGMARVMTTTAYRI